MEFPIQIHRARKSAFISELNQGLATLGYCHVKRYSN